MQDINTITRDNKHNILCPHVTSYHVITCHNISSHHITVSSSSTTNDFCSYHQLSLRLSYNDAKQNDWCALIPLCSVCPSNFDWRCVAVTNVLFYFLFGDILLWLFAVVVVVCCWFSGRLNHCVGDLTGLFDWTAEFWLGYLTGTMIISLRTHHRHRHHPHWFHPCKNVDKINIKKEEFYRGDMSTILM